MRYIIENKDYQFYIGTANSLMRTPHIHTHLEMIYMVEGRSKAILDGREYEMGQGDLFVAFPNQVHGYDPQTPVKIFLVIFSGDMDPDMGGLLKNKIPADPIVRAASMPEDTARWLGEIMEQKHSQQSWEQLSAKYQLLDFLSRVLPKVSYLSQSADRDSIKDILNYCAEHFTEPITLDSVAKALHLSKYYISHIITERMGVSFTKFVNSMRVEHACTLLDRGMNIIDICFSSGFSSVRNFNRVFLQLQGVQPSQYIKKRTGIGQGGGNV